MRWPSLRVNEWRASRGAAREAAAVGVLEGPTMGWVTAELFTLAWAPAVDGSRRGPRRSRRERSGLEGGQHLPGIVTVTAHLNDQVVDRVELQLVSESADEPHPAGLVV